MTVLRNDEIENHGGKLGNGLPLVTPKQLANRLGISSRQVLRLPITPHRLGPKTIRYSEEDINEYLKKTRTIN